MEHMEARMQDRYDAYDDAVNSRLAARAIKLWRESCAVELIPSVDVLEGNIEASIQAARKDWTQASIDAAPLSLRRLGEVLSNKLDDDEWNNVEPLLVSISSAMAGANALLSIAKRWGALDGGSWNVDRHAREKQELLEDTRAAIAKAEGK